MLCRDCEAATNYRLFAQSKEQTNGYVDIDWFEYKSTQFVA